MCRAHLSEQLSLLKQDLVLPREGCYSLQLSLPVWICTFREKQYIEPLLQCQTLYNLLSGWEINEATKTAARHKHYICLKCTLIVYSCDITTNHKIFKDDETIHYSSKSALHALFCWVSLYGEKCVMWFYNMCVFPDPSMTEEPCLSSVSELTMSLWLC